MSLVSVMEGNGGKGMRGEKGGRRGWGKGEGEKEDVGMGERGEGKRFGDGKMRRREIKGIGKGRGGKMT